MSKFLTTIAAVIGTTILVGQLAPHSIPSFFYETLILLVAGTCGLYFYLVRIHQARPDLFIQFFIATLVLKLLGYSVYIFIMFSFDEPGAVPNAVFFAIMYFIFTGVGVYFVHRQITR